MNQIPREPPRSDEGLRRYAGGEHHRIARDYGSFSPAIPVAVVVLFLIAVGVIIRLVLLG